MKKQRFLLVVGLLLGCWMALSVGLTLAGQFAQPPNVQSGWTAVFTETFTNTLSMWTFTETTSTGYQWGVVPYSRTVDNELVNDYGLWASGGGSAGENLVWPTDTYTTGMDTRAVVGPISLTKEIIEASLNFHVYNNIDQDDVFSVAFSLDGISFVDVITVTTAPTSWEQLNWNSSAVRGATELWIVFSFTSDNASEPHLGPLVDDVVLEVRSGGTVYLPLVRQDPTPTPTLTPTPLPVYVDHFIDPNSGWYDGPAMRLNCRKDNVGDCTWVWEEVATMRYLSGEYQMYIPLTAHGGGLVDTWFVRAAEFAPLPEAMYPLPQNYCVESRAIFANAQNNGEPYIAHWGLVFGGDALKTDIYTFQINSLGKYHVIRYNNYVYPGNRDYGGLTNTEIKLINFANDPDWGDTGVGINPSTHHNILKAAVRGDQVDVYINGQYVNTVSIAGMPRDHVGIIGASYEFTPVDLHYDYFRYDPFCPEVQ